MLSEEKILFLSQLIFTMRAEIVSLEKEFSSGNEKEVFELRNSILELTSEVERAIALINGEK
jgi:hypothetical protein